MREWIDKANPTYPCLIDKDHTIAELYDMVNVPNAVWINEEGQIVRSPEPAGWNDGWRTNNQEDLKQSKNAYFDALRDWVQKGQTSQYVLPAEEVSRRMSGPTKEHVLAIANFRMGLYLTELGDEEKAKIYFNKAIKLHPDSWNIKRQSWWLVESKEEQRNKFLEALNELQDRPYYPPVELIK